MGTRKILSMLLLTVAMLLTAAATLSFAPVTVNAAGEIGMEAGGLADGKTYTDDDTAQYTVDVYLQHADGTYSATHTTSYLKVGSIGAGGATAAGTERSYPNYTFDAAAGNVLSADLIGDNATSQQLKLYYKRNTVSLTVDLAAGTASGITEGTTTDHVWGKQIALGANPTRTGYTFSHWTVDSGTSADILGSTLTLGTTHTTITAHWTQNPAPSEVIYEIEVYLMNVDGTYDGTASLKMKKAALPGTNTASASETDWSSVGYTYESGEGKADLSATAATFPTLRLYYKRDTAGFTVTDGGSNTVTDPGNLVWGSTVTLDAAPTKDGYTFACWSMESGTGTLAGNVLTLGAGNTVVKANWLAVANYKVNIFLQKEDGTYDSKANTVVIKSGIVGADGATAEATDWSGEGYVYDRGAGSADLNVDGSTTPELNLYYVRGAGKMQDTLTVVGGNVTKTYGAGTFTLETSGGSGNGAITWASSHPDLVSVNSASGLATIHGATNATTVTITATKDGGTNYNDISATITVTVSKAVLTVTADDKFRAYGESNPTFTVSYSDFVNGENENALTIKPTAACAADASTPTGTASITVSGGASDNYSFNYVAGTLTIITTGQTPAPATGDNSNMILWLLLGGASLTALGGIAVMGCKRKRYTAVKR